MPSVEGGLSLLFVNGDKYADIECDNDGDVLVGMSDRTGDPELWELNLEGNNLNTTVDRIREFLKN